MPTDFYPIGTPGQPWSEAEFDQWKARVAPVKRSYKDDVLSRVEAIKAEGHFEVVQYGALSHDVARYPLVSIRTKSFDASKPYVLITGGVHGYETSGVKGVLQFAETAAKDFEKNFNLVICPCVSPWGYERIQRWTALAMDPNRHFIPQSPVEECAQLMAYVESLGVKFSVHFDCHETTDSDESEFEPAKAARDGKTFTPDAIPDGYYLVAGSEDPDEEWHKAINDAVRQVTHIAPEKTIIGVPITQEGVIQIPGRTMGLCGGFLKLRYAVTTEVYPDSPKVDDKNCNEAQVATIVSGLQYLIDKKIQL